MHGHDLTPWSHDHRVPAFDRNEARTKLVVAITASMMVVELTAGWLTGSMALLADGWHMATHAGALGLTVGGYWFARRYANAPTLTFGPGKVFSLAGYTSAVTLAIVALLMFWESAWRLLDPGDIRFDQALGVAVIGLVVNIGCALLLGHDHDHEAHDHDHDQDHEAHDHHDGAHHADLNIRAAYLHVLADALTSLLAIAALLGGRTFGWSFLDPLMGIVGGLVILKWSWGLLRTAGQVLLDSAPGVAPLERARRALEAMDDVRVADLHLWALAPGRLACVASVVTHEPRPVEEYHAVLRAATGAHHVTVEVRHCDSGDDEELRAVS
jgi:cation diffusion facilitator family transporter